MLSKTLTCVAALAASVSAHGYIDNATLADILYTGYQPYNDPYQSPPPQRIFRPIPSNGPVQDVTLIDLQCNGDTAGGKPGSKGAPLTSGPVAAGSTVSLSWTIWPSSHVGPVLTYMAACPSSGCTDYIPGTDAVWFKVAEGGRVGTSDVWADTPMMTPGNEYTFIIPSCLQSGDYIVRHEIIALHSAFTYPGAQFYPGCFQIQVTGSGADTGPATKVAFPGAYQGTDPGITYNVYANPPTTYPIPGPPVWTC